MTWLGYPIIFTNEQKVGVIVVTVLFFAFGVWNRRPAWMCFVGAILVGICAIGYAINDNAMQQLRSEIRK